MSDDSHALVSSGRVSPGSHRADARDCLDESDLARALAQTSLADASAAKTEENIKELIAWLPRYKDICTELLMPELDSIEHFFQEMHGFTRAKDRALWWPKTLKDSAGNAFQPEPSPELFVNRVQYYRERCAAFLGYAEGLSHDKALSQEEIDVLWGFVMHTAIHPSLRFWSRAKAMQEYCNGPALECIKKRLAQK